MGVTDCRPNGTNYNALKIPCQRTAHACPLSYSVVFESVTVVKLWTIILMLNKKALDMQRQEVLWSLSGTHMSIYWGFESLLPALKLL